MLAFGEALRRFRLGGVPGAPATAGVPADRPRALADELAPVFAALEPAQQQAQAILSDGRQRADDIRAGGARSAAAALAEAAARAPGEQAAAAAAGLARADDERERLLNAAQERADAVAAAATARLEPLASAALEALLR